MLDKTTHDAMPCCIAAVILVVVATGKAWQTPLGRYAPQRSESAAEGAAWAVVLQLPLEGLLSSGGGVHFVVKRAQGSQPEWLSGPHNKDFFISLEQVATQLLGSLTATSLSLISGCSILGKQAVQQ